MKKQMTANLSKTLRNVLTSAVFVSVLMIGSAKAAETKSDAAPVEVNYLGQVDNHPVFQINFDNPTQENFFVTLTDESGNMLFNGRFNDKKFSKKFKLQTDDVNGMKIKMSLTSGTGKKTQVFEVNNVAKVIQEVVVTKVD